MTATTTPGQAMEEVLATLRHFGYSADEVSSIEDTYQGIFTLTGNLEMGTTKLGLFTAEVDYDGNQMIEAGAFGSIENGHMDPFSGL